MINGMEHFLSYIHGELIVTRSFELQTIISEYFKVENVILGRVHIPFYLLIQHLYRDSKLSALQVRLVSDGKLKRIQRKTYRRLQAKSFDLWDDYASKEKTAQRLLKACSHLNGPVRSV